VNRVTGWRITSYSFRMQLHHDATEFHHDVIELRHGATEFHHDVIELRHGVQNFRQGTVKFLCKRFRSQWDSAAEADRQVRERSTPVFDGAGPSDGSTLQGQIEDFERQRYRERSSDSSLAASALWRGSSTSPVGASGTMASNWRIASPKRSVST